MKQKILISIDWFLPGTNAGGPVRSIANLTDQLKDINFYIITSDTDYCADKPYEGIIANQWTKHSENVQVYYFSVNNLTKEKISQVITETGIQTIYINGVYSNYFSRIPISIAKEKDLKAIVATRGMLSPHALAVKPLKKRLFLLLQNSLHNYSHVHFHVTNNDEKRDVQKMIKDFKSISVIPNLPRKVSPSDDLPIQKEEGIVKIISLGRIAEEKGTLESLEALKNVKGNIVVDLYGTIYEQSYWEKCLSTIEKLPQSIQVNYKNSLEAEEVIPTLQQYHFMLLPSKGENYGHSIIESFIAERPVIISKNTPWKNLQEKNIGFDVEEKELSDTIQKATDMNHESYAQMINSIKSELDKLLSLKSTKLKYINLLNQQYKYKTTSNP